MVYGCGNIPFHMMETGQMAELPLRKEKQQAQQYLLTPAASHVQVILSRIGRQQLVRLLQLAIILELVIL